MMSYDRDELEEELNMDEGRERFLYKDNADPPNWSIGVGRNIQAKGLSEACIDLCLQEDIDEAEQELDRIDSRWRELSNVRQRVLMNMMFNMGAGVFNGVLWPNFFAAVENRDWMEASRQMVSKWSKQVGVRAVRLRQMMEQG